MASTDGWLKEQMQGLRSFAGSPGANIQLAQMSPEQEAWARKYDPKAMKPATVKTPPAPAAPAAPAPDPLKLKESLEGRMKGAGLADSPIMVAAAQDPAMNSREGRYIQSATQNPNSLGAPSVLPPATAQPPAGVGGGPLLPLMPEPVRNIIQKRNSDMDKMYNPGSQQIGPGPNHPWRTGVPVPGAPMTPGGTPPIPAPRSGVNFEEVQTAARGGSFDEGDEVLVGEEGPELVQLGGPATVTPLANSGEAPVFGQPRRVNQEAAIGGAAAASILGLPTNKKEGQAFVKKAGATGKRWAQGIRNVAANPMGAARNLGAGAGTAVNVGEAAARAVPELAEQAAQGYRSTRPGAPQQTPGSARVGYDPTRFPGGQPLPGGASGGAGGPPPRGPLGSTFDPGGAESPRGGGRFDAAKAAMAEQARVSGAPYQKAGEVGVKLAKGGLGLAGGIARRAPLIANIYEVADTASRMASPGITSAERKTEGVRGVIRGIGQSAFGVLGGIGGAGLGTLALPGPGTIAGGAAGIAGGTYAGGELADKLSNFLLGPQKGQSLLDRVGGQNAAPPGAPPPAQTGGDDVVQSGSIGVKESDAEMAGLDRQNSLRAGRVQAAREAAVQNASPEAGGTGIPIGGLRYGRANAGATSARQERRWGMMDEALDVARERNRITAASERAKLLQAQNAADLDKRKVETAEEEAGAKRVEDLIKSGGVELTGKKKESSFGFGGEDDKGFEGRGNVTTADFRGDVHFSVGNRKDGKKIGQMTPGEVQQLFLAKRVKDKFIAGRGDTVQFIRDFFGTKQFNSRDLYSYLPRTGPKGELMGAEIAQIPGGGSFLLRAKNGSSMTATRGMGGEWNLTGPNGAIDSDIAALFSKHLDAAEKRGGR